MRRIGSSLTRLSLLLLYVCDHTYIHTYIHTLFSPNEQRAGEGGGRCQTFFFFFPCSADHERDWPPCKVVFFGLATNALNVRNDNNNIIHTYIEICF